MAEPTVPDQRPLPPGADATDLPQVWTRTLASLGDSLSPQHRAFLRLTRPMAIVGDTVLIAAPNDFARDVIENRLRTVLTEALSGQLQHEVQLAVTVDPTATGDSTPLEELTDEVADGTFAADLDAAGHAGADLSAPGPSTTGASEPGWSAAGASTPLQPTADPFEPTPSRPGSGQPPGRRDTEPSRLNPKYTFDTFVIGSSNRFAHAAAVAVAEAPAKAYNPLFVYGESGLGKTHLLHAIGHYARSLYTGARVRYVSSEEFTNDFINTHPRRQGRRLPAPLPRRRRPARRRHPVPAGQGADAGGVLPHLQHAAQRQQADRHHLATCRPSSCPTFEDRMRSRFEWGLITDVQPPDLETRIAILRKKAAQERLSAPPEVLEYIASARSRRNIRELEGALIRVTAFASLNRQPVDLALAEVVLKDLIPDRPGPEITVGDDHGADRGLLRAVRSRTCAARPAPGCSSPPARSPCTCAASSPTCRCPRSASSSAAATTPRSCTPTARSAS